MSEQLLELQQLDTTLRQLRHRREHLEQRDQLAAAVAQQEVERGKVAAVESQRDGAQDRQRTAETEAQQLADRADANDARLYSGEVSGLKDLEALQAEIAGLRERQGGFEEQALEAMEEIDGFEAQIADLDAARAELDEQVENLRAEITAAEAEIDVEIEQVEQARADLAGDVDATLLGEYDKRRPAFGAATIVTFDGHRCVGCPSTMPAVEVDRIKRLNDAAPADCAECGRIVLH